MFDLIQFTLLMLAVVFAVVTIEIKDLIYAILFFCLMCIFIGVFYWSLSAPYVAVFQLLIYAGAVVALFVVAVMLTVRRELR